MTVALSPETCDFVEREVGWRPDEFEKFVDTASTNPRSYTDPAMELETLADLAGVLASRIAFLEDALREDESCPVEPDGKELRMSETDPRVVAAALHLSTDDLARVLTGFAKDALPAISYEPTWAPPSLERFDAHVAAARTYLVEAHAAQAAWEIDNPADTDADE